MKNPLRFALPAALLFVLAMFGQGNGVKAAGGSPEAVSGPYRVLAPIESGNLLLFPVVRANGKFQGETPFITLDEGIRSGEVEVTESGRARGLVRPRDRVDGPNSIEPFFRHRPELRGDEVNTLVLVNHSKQPLLLLAGEIVTVGKQDRVIAKDRIVPAGGDPVDLSVFCIEPGRWTESSAIFGATAKMPSHGFMVQPTVRERAMAGRDQQQVWDSVHGAIAQMQRSAGVSGRVTTAEMRNFNSFGTTSYAKVMQTSAVSEKVDETAAPVMKAQEQVLAQLRQEHAVGLVVAVRGEIVWADLFASTDLLARYWTKLVRSYAAESLAGSESLTAPAVADAQHFLDVPADGTETSEGEVGVYRCREIKSGATETFVLESLLPGTGYDVHVSKMKLRNAGGRIKTFQIYR
jgi:hypothetical protein